MNGTTMPATHGVRLDGLDRRGLLSPGAMPMTRRQASCGSGWHSHR